MEVGPNGPTGEGVGQRPEELREWAEGAQEGSCLQTEVLQGLTVHHVLEHGTAAYSSSDISINTYYHILSQWSSHLILRLSFDITVLPISQMRPLRVPGHKITPLGWPSRELCTGWNPPEFQIQPSFH